MFIWVIELQNSLACVENDACKFFNSNHAFAFCFSQTPIAQELMRSLKKEVTVDTANAILMRNHTSLLPVTQILNNRTKVSIGVLPESRGYDPLSVAGCRVSFVNASHEDIESVGSRCRSNLGNSSVRDSIGPYTAMKNG